MDGSVEKIILPMNSVIRLHQQKVIYVFCSFRGEVLVKRTRRSNVKPYITCRSCNPPLTGAHSSKMVYVLYPSPMRQLPLITPAHILGMEEPTAQNCSSLLVIGVGQMRTGTTSLKSALETLFQAPCYHMSDVAFRLKEQHIRKWIYACQVCNGSAHEAKIALQLFKPFWDSIYGMAVSAVDYPTCVFYRQLMSVYPKAKFILTTRDPDEWVRSCRATTMCPDMLRKLAFGEKLYFRWCGVGSLPELHHYLFQRAFGASFATMSDEELKKAYTEWNKLVTENIPSKRLLLFDPREGWGPLCKFLCLPEPSITTPFPHMNGRDEMRARIQRSFGAARLFYILYTFCESIKPCIMLPPYCSSPAPYL
ncbi:unnamed protein product [Dicrocoelium dendriticum]|nr:unnamed protein product [Dicrocoelium dendriticum]